ncbi:MAG TPA: hypothetical protein VF807_10255, partial [Ktedonobacterales bacterium]
LRGAGIVLALTVAAVALLPRAGVSLPEIVTRMLIPGPTATPHAGVLAMGSWQAIAPPPTAGAFQVVPSPKDPDTVYACATPGAQAAGRVPATTPIIVWTTHNAGASWQPLRATTGTGCFLQVARDDPTRLALSVTNDANGLDAGSCARTRFFLSPDAGATWVSVPHQAIDLAGAQLSECVLWPTAGWLYMMSFAVPQGQGSAAYALEASVDAGQHWTRFGDGLPASAHVMPETLGQPWTFAVQVPEGGSGQTTRTYVSYDSGANWFGFPALTTQTSIEIIYSGLGNGTIHCGCVVATGNINQSPIDYQMQLWLSDGKAWTQAPPIPSQGVLPGRTGLATWLGVTQDGRVLVTGLPPQLSATPSPRVWAFDLYARTWAVATTAMTVPCDRQSGCYLGALGMTRTPAGSYLWVMNGRLGPIYRAFVPKR